MQMLQCKWQNADFKTYVLAIPSVLGGVLGGLLLCLMNYERNVGRGTWMCKKIVSKM